MKRHLCYCGVLIPTLILLLVAGWQPSRAASLGETSTCAVPGAYATIQAAVDDAACALISVAAGTFVENIHIERPLAIHGQGPAATVVDGDGDHAINIQLSTELDQSVAMTVTLRGLEIVNGDAGLYVEAQNRSWDQGYGLASLFVNISRSAIRGNAGSGIRANPHDYGLTRIRLSQVTIDGNLGPGIDNESGLYGTANLQLLNSTISDNVGAGIWSPVCGRGFCRASLEVTASTISGNAGSGIYNGDQATVTNSTISGNTASHGGGVYSCGATYLYNSTVSGNAAGTGAGLFIVGSDIPYGCRGRVIAGHSIVANGVGAADCALYIDQGPWAAYFGDDGHNIVEDGTCIDAPSSSSGDPMLGSLAKNDGPTMTHALLPGSPAIDAGDNTACPATDQRGRPRPEDGDENGTATCDIGSFEARPILEYVDRPSFTSAAGGYLNPITFEGLPAGTIVTDQYLDLGASFVDGNDAVMNSSFFVTDNVGLAGNGRVHVQLTRPAVAIAADFPGGLTIDLYDHQGGLLVYTSANFAGTGTGFFGGVVTDIPFSFVVFRDWVDDAVFLDNIHLIRYDFGTFLPLALK